MSVANREISYSQPSLITPNLDIWLIGGGSILLLAMMSVMLNTSWPDPTVGWWVFNLSFVVNFPHFLASYQLLYSDFGGKVFKQFRYFWAGVLVPILLVAVFAIGIAASSAATWGYLATSMYFFVGWHYVKQIFGGITVTNAVAGFFYNKFEKMVLKANLFSLWAVSFLGANVGEHSYAMSGITYHSLNLPQWTLTASKWTIGLTAVFFIYLNIRKYVVEGKTPTTTAAVCFASIYAWYLPAMSHPMFQHTIPFFHSLQYLLFVYVFRRNKVAALVGQPATPEARKKRVLGLWAYLAIPFITGAFFMWILPQKLDQLQVLDATIFGASACYFAFTVFINIHHYFIDNVIWRGDNDEMKQFLFRRETPSSVTTSSEAQAA